MQNYSYGTPEKDVLLFPEHYVVYAGFWERFAAALIDGFILFMPNLLFQYMLGSGSIVVSIIIGWLYGALQESGPHQATLGKRIMGLKVITLDGQQISFGQATGRHFGKFISSIILCIGYLMMLWDDNKQTLHDKMAGSLVIKK